MAIQDTGFNSDGFSSAWYCTNISDNSNKITNLAGVYETENMPLSYETGIVGIAFYDASDNIVTPAGGTAVVEASIMDGQWLAASTGGTIDATTCGASATYEVPTFVGPVSKGRVTFSGAFGAGISYCRVVFWRI